MTKQELQNVIDNEQAIGAWTEKMLSRKLIRPTYIDSEEESGFWTYGHPVKSRGRRASDYPRLYFVSKSQSV